jgi:hypothetical protein
MCSLRSLDSSIALRAPIRPLLTKELWDVVSGRARAQSINDPERRADMLRFAGMWLSLTEPIKGELRGAYEFAAQEGCGLMVMQYSPWQPPLPP